MSKKTLIVKVKTKYGSFQCTFGPEKDMGGYVAEARGVQGAISWGKTLSQAKKMVAEAIEGAIEARAIAAAEKKGIIQVIKRARYSILATA